MNSEEISPGSGPEVICKVEPLTQRVHLRVFRKQKQQWGWGGRWGRVRPQHCVTEGTTEEEHEEYEEEMEGEPGPSSWDSREGAASVRSQPRQTAGAGVSTVETVTQENVAAPKTSAEGRVYEGTIKEDVSEDTEDKYTKSMNRCLIMTLMFCPKLLVVPSHPW